MKILLINPSPVHEIKGPHPLKAKDMAVFPHLGLMSIAAVLKRDNEFDVKLLDMSLERCDHDGLRKVLREFQPVLVGLTTYTDCLYDIKLVVELLRQESPQLVICAGGPHVEIYPKEALELLPIDCLIRGDGEYSFRELCRRARDKAPWQDVRGVGYLKDGQAVLNAPWIVESLDELPFPARELSSLDKVQSAVARGDVITSICSSRGCPFPCTFCNSPYKKYRLRSVNSVIDEMVDCHDRFGVKEFFFFDDLFNLTKERVVEFCEVLQKRVSFKVEWSFRGRIGGIDEETLRLCRKVGCNRIHFGVEAGTDRILNLYKKNLKLEEVVRVFKACHKVGMETVANFIIGAPTETKEEILETIRFSHRINPTFVEYHVLVPYPYTQIYQGMLQKGTLKKDVWTEFARNPHPDFRPPLCEDTLGADELYALLNHAYRDFYFRPMYMCQHLFKMNSFGDFARKAWGAYRLLTVTRKA